MKDDVSLKEYLLEKINSLEKLTDERFKTSQIAINKAEEAQKLRNEAQNEWRQSMKDREATYATKAEMQRNAEDIKGLRESRSEISGKSEQSKNIYGYAVGITGLLFGFVSLLLKFTIK